MKIPYPDDLNPIELAVWAAEFVRVAAIHSANDAVDDMRSFNLRQLQAAEGK